ncbi:MAG: hypothetical protein AB7L28_14175, partial [Kofleriaceae bacterium]
TTLFRSDERRARALLGRARARYRLQRIRDALTDLDEVIAIASERKLAKLELEGVLERATALDWSDDWTGSAVAAVRAKELLATAPCPELEVEVRLAEARSLWRARSFDAAAPILHAVKIDARAGSKYETQIIAELMLATLYVDIGNFDDASREFDELIPICELRGDRLHLGVAYANRSWLWSASGEVDQCAADLRKAIQIAREIGQPVIERTATYNLAESMLWAGALDEALQLARRSVALQSAYGESVEQHDQLLVARVSAARGDRDALGLVLASLDTSKLTASDQIVVKVLRCVVDRAGDSGWRDALTGSDTLGVDTQLELAYLATKANQLASPFAEQIKSLATKHPIWSRRGVF